MRITICLKILVSVTTENISPSNRSDICTSSSASNLWKSSAPHYWETQAWQSSRARYQPNQWSSGASDFHQELQSKFTIDKKHEHCSKLHEQHSHCFDLSEKIHIKSRSTNLPLVPKLCQELSVKIPAKPWSFLFAPEAAVVWLKNPCNLKPWFKLSTKHKNIKNTATTKTTQTTPVPHKSHFFRLTIFPPTDSHTHQHPILFQWSCSINDIGETPSFCIILGFQHKRNHSHKR